jgi:hypothetical protein
LFLHDNCTAQYPPQPDTCLHDRLHEQSFTFGGKPGTVYDVTRHIRGIFEPTTILGGDTPDPGHPYFKAGGTVSRFSTVAIKGLALEILASPNTTVPHLT